MNNQNYGYAEQNLSVPLDLPQSMNNILNPYQSSCYEVETNFQQTSVPVDDQNYFQNVNFQQMPGDGNVLNLPVSNIEDAGKAETAQTAESNNCSSDFHGRSVHQDNIVSFSQSCDQTLGSIHNSFCAEYPNNVNESTAASALPAHLELSQEMKGPTMDLYPSKYQSLQQQEYQDFNGHQNNFTNDPSPSDKDGFNLNSLQANTACVDNFQMSTNYAFDSGNLFCQKNASVLADTSSSQNIDDSSKVLSQDTNFEASLVKNLSAFSSLRNSEAVSTHFEETNLMSSKSNGGHLSIVDRTPAEDGVANVQTERETVPFIDSTMEGFAVRCSNLASPFSDSNTDYFPPESELCPEENHGPEFLHGGDENVDNRNKRNTQAEVVGHTSSEFDTDEAPSVHTPMEVKPMEDEPLEFNQTEEKSSEVKLRRDEPREVIQIEDKPSGVKLMEDEPMEVQLQEDESSEAKLMEDEHMEVKQTEDKLSEVKLTEDASSEAILMEDEPMEGKQTEDESSEFKQKEDESSVPKPMEDKPMEGKQTEDKSSEVKLMEDETKLVKAIDDECPEVTPLEDKPTEEEYGIRKPSNLSETSNTSHLVSFTNDSPLGKEHTSSVHPHNGEVNACRAVPEDSLTMPSLSDNDILSNQPLDQLSAPCEDAKAGSVETLSNEIVEDESVLSSTSNKLTSEDVSLDLSEDRNIAEPLSPMITLLDNDFYTSQDAIKGEKGNNSEKEETVEPFVEENATAENLRLTRTRTGTLRNKVQRLVDEISEPDGSSMDSSSYNEWEYEDGVELAPSKAENFIKVPDCVLMVTSAELAYYQQKFGTQVEAVLNLRLHCTTCDKHIGAAPAYFHVGNRHKVLRVLICDKCRSFYGAGRFRRDSDGSELYCRWCGQGGAVICCSTCPNVFCECCIQRNFGPEKLSYITGLNDWSCFVCNYKDLWYLRSVCWALLSYTTKKKREALGSTDPQVLAALEVDQSVCCPFQPKVRRKPKSRHQSQNFENSAEKPFRSKNNSGPAFQHFLFPNDDFGNIQRRQDAHDVEEDDFIDPSQFVQPVLEEPIPSTSRVAPHRTRVALPPASMPPLTQKEMPSPQVSLGRARPLLSGSTPRLLVRQGNLLQPGLVPINKQPNSISNSGGRPPVFLRNSQQSGSQTLQRGAIVNSSPPVNNIDGVRSMEQLFSLEQVPWFRDGIDSVRAVGFAMSKRMRELEARFHSVKNKSDMEKVMALGRKLERFCRRTEIRFQQINYTLKEACKQWYLSKSSRITTRPYLANPFSLYKENDSDWDDDAELSRPLEKVLIPVNPAALHGSGARVTFRPSSIQAPPLSLPRPTSIQAPPLSLPRPTSIQAPPLSLMTPSFASGNLVGGRAVPEHNYTRPTTSGPSEVSRKAVLPKPYFVVSSQPTPLSPVRLPGPKSSVARYGPRPVGPRLHDVACQMISTQQSFTTLLNERNGPNSVSITLTSSKKRKRLDSEDSDCVVDVHPSIPELVELYKIKPCHVRVLKDDSFITSFLEKQEKNRSENCISDLLEDVVNVDDHVSEEETIEVICDFPDDIHMALSERRNSVESSDVHMTDVNQCSSDDDIEIIEEINPNKP